jgi:hypothetical protein
MLQFGCRPVAFVAQPGMGTASRAAEVVHRNSFRFSTVKAVPPKKKVVRHCEFSEKFGILEKHHVSNDATENARFLSNLICLPGNGP